MENIVESEDELDRQDACPTAPIPLTEKKTGAALFEDEDENEDEGEQDAPFRKL